MDLIIHRVLKLQQESTSRPFILLTWAQTTDAMVSYGSGIRTQISGTESSALTHSLRAIHDAILVGIGTVLADDPRLSTRLDERDRNAVQSHLRKFARQAKYNDLCPTAVILDPSSRTPQDSKVLSQPHCDDSARKPFIFTSETNKSAASEGLNTLARLVRTTTIQSGKSNKCHLPTVVDRLSSEGIRSVMVEGGPSVLASFLSQGLCNLVIVTIAPVLFGRGVPFASANTTHKLDITRLANPQWLQLGADMILVGEPINST